MSAAAEGSVSTTKATVADATSSSTLKDQQKPAAALEEDDEFEDFPVDGSSAFYIRNVYTQLTFFFARSDWPQEDAEVPGEGDNTHLWEESWDDDDTSEDFSKQLKLAAKNNIYSLICEC